MIGLAAMVGTAVQPALAAPAEPVSLTKVTKWEVNYDEDSCHLLAGFGTGDDLVVLSLTRYQPASDFDVVLTGAMFTPKRVAAPIKLGFGETMWPRPQAADGASAGQKPFVMFTHVRLDGKVVNAADDSVAQVSPAMEAATTSAKIAFADKTYRLETGSLAAPMAAMRACTDSLLTALGYDPVVQAQLQRHPQPTESPARWITYKDYPDKALRRRQDGLVQFRLDIDERGGVTGCKVLRRYKDDPFADLVCQLIKQRAHFRPAIDAAGKPVRSYYVNNVVFFVP
ncbi:MAG: energy transducer TonB [Novosphingobium sp.]